MKTPLAIAIGLLVAANVVLASVVGYSVWGRAKAEAALEQETATRQHAEKMVESLASQVAEVKAEQRQQEKRHLDDLAAKQKETDAAWAYATEMGTPLKTGETFDGDYFVDGCSNTLLKLRDAKGNERYVSTSGLLPYWKARAGVTVIEAVSRN